MASSKSKEQIIHFVSTLENQYSISYDATRLLFYHTCFPDSYNAKH